MKSINRRVNARSAAPVSVAGLLLAGGLLLGVVGCSPQGAAPDPAQTAAVATSLRAGSTTDDGTTVLGSTSVGDSVFVLGQRGSDIRFGASFDGSDPDQNWETFGSPAEVAADGLTVVNPGNFPDAAPGGLATVTGQVGTDVVGLDIVTHAGDTVAASVGGGYYLAAWEGRDFDDRDTLDARFVMHLADGSSRTVGYHEATEG